MREIKGKKYDKDMTTKEIGREVKKYIKENFRNKHSVRTSHNTISIKIELKEDNFAKTREEISDIGINYRTKVLDELERQGKLWTDTNIENYLKEVKVLNKKTGQMYEDVKKFLADYNRDNSDPYTDYFDVKFYSNISLTFEGSYYN